jgi:hypothetical protein
MKWNFRIGTNSFSYKDTFKDQNEKLALRPDERLFSVIEVYYDKDGKPTAYGEINPLNDWDNMKDLKGTYDLIADAFNKPIIDLDNFPNEYKE